MAETGSIDIVIVVSLSSSHLANHREEYFEAALHVMAYLKQKQKSRLLFDPTYPKIN